MDLGYNDHTPLTSPTGHFEKKLKLKLFHCDLSQLNHFKNEFTSSLAITKRYWHMSYGAPDSRQIAKEMLKKAQEVLKRCRSCCNFLDSYNLEFL